MTGYPLYGAVWIILIEGAAILILPRLVSNGSPIHKQALKRCLQAARRITIAEIVFLIFALMPAIAWRIRFGVWLSGQN